MGTGRARFDAWCSRRGREVGWVWLWGGLSAQASVPGPHLRFTSVVMVVLFLQRLIWVGCGVLGQHCVFRWHPTCSLGLSAPLPSSFWDFSAHSQAPLLPRSFLFLLPFLRVCRSVSGRPCSAWPRNHTLPAWESGPRAPPTAMPPIEQALLPCPAAPACSSSHIIFRLWPFVLAYH